MPFPSSSPLLLLFALFRLALSSVASGNRLDLNLYTNTAYDRRTLLPHKRATVW